MDSSDQPVQEKNSLIAFFRWVAVLPVAIGAFFLIQVFVGLISTMRTGLEVDRWSQFFNSILGPYCFVWVGARMAPFHRFITSLVLAIIHAIVFTAICVSAILLTEMDSFSKWWLILCTLVGVVATIIACVQYRYVKD